MCALCFLGVMCTAIKIFICNYLNSLPVFFVGLRALLAGFVSIICRTCVCIYTLYCQSLSRCEQVQAEQIMSADNFLRLYEQLRAVWKCRDKEQPFVRGYFLTRSRSPAVRNGYHQNGGRSPTEVVERWFTLLGHALFYCTSKDSPEYSGAMLTDIFSPVMARVDDKTLNSFGALETQQVCHRHCIAAC